MKIFQKLFKKSSGQSQPIVKLCRECKHYVPDKTLSRCGCTNPIVNSHDEWALSSEFPSGTNARDERSRKMPWAFCGMKGKLWEPKDKPTVEIN